MDIALRELLRRPGRFSSVGGALTLLVLLLVVLGGFLDGLELSQTGSYRALGDALLSYDDEAELQRARSAVAVDARDTVADLDGVADVGTLNALATTARAVPEGAAGDADTAGDDGLVDVLVLGYTVAAGRLPAPPAPGTAVVDEALSTTEDVAVGDTITVGPRARELEVVDTVADASEGVPTVWVSEDTWAQVAGDAGPSAALRPGTAQVLVTVPTQDADPATLAERIDAATGATDTVTVAGAIDALPVVQQQSATFEGIIGVTFVVSLLVVALFFALITLERRKLYAVLKALGATSRDLLGGVTVQAIGVAVVALVLGTAAAVLLVAVLPDDLPLRIEPVRLAAIAVGTVSTAVVGGLFTLRRLLRIDPAESIG